MTILTSANLIALKAIKLFSKYDFSSMTRLIANKDGDIEFQIIEDEVEQNSSWDEIWAPIQTEEDILTVQRSLEEHRAKGGNPNCDEENLAYIIGRRISGNRKPVFVGSAETQMDSLEVFQNAEHPPVSPITFTELELESGQILIQVVNLVEEISWDTGFYANLVTWKWNFEEGVMETIPEHFYTSADCSDFFEWGTADSERITVENLPILHQASTEVNNLTANDEIGESRRKHFAGLLFASRVRNLRPQGAYYKRIPETLSNAFNDAGPERTVGLSNPHSQP